MRGYGPYNAVVDKVQDADTLYLKLDIGFDITIYGRCRLFGINAPELSAPEGRAAAQFVRSICPLGTVVQTTSMKWDKYGGRYDGTITLPDGTDLATLLIASGYATVVRY